ncbi:MAG TPA: CopD family protein [Promineifilum sp.]|nr:CopD family protein [Promineifilum sp.]HRO92272.1 CopD family protein [Promineifilum sp.]HRQ14605.1 CopD family protein [Promineifilum sp.]
MQSVQPVPQEHHVISADTAVPATKNQLLDKYALPKVALTVIAISSLVGTWLTMTTHGAGAWSSVLPRWLHLVSFGLLAGGYMWKGLFTQPAHRPAQSAYVAAFVRAQFARFRRLAWVVLGVYFVTGLLDLVRFSEMGVGWPIWLGAALMVAITLVVMHELYLRRPDDPFAERPEARLVLGLLVIDALFQATFDVALSQGGAWWPLLVRWLHLTAFGLWIGGAVWNIFITVPAARQTIAIPVVVAAGRQLERFRVVVRMILPALIVTGLIQAYRYVGFSLDALLYSSIGHVILIKIGLVLVLIGVFLTCPLWRACSPISGMCKLDELYDADPSTGR